MSRNVTPLVLLLITLMPRTAVSQAQQQEQRAFEEVRGLVQAGMNEDPSEFEPYWKREGDTLYYIFEQGPRILPRYRFSKPLRTLASVEYMKHHRKAEY